MKLAPYNILFARDFRFMTFPAFRHLLGNRNITGMEARHEGAAVGLALATPSTDRTAKILSLFVAEPFRKQGYGTQLLVETENLLAKSGTRRLVATYMTGRPFTVTIEHMLTRLEWEPPETRTLVFEMTVDSISEAPWNAETNFPPNFNPFPWRTITPSERTQLLEDVTNGNIPGDLSPFLHEVNSHPETSLGIRHDGKVVGWSLTHRMTNQQIRFSCSYILPEWQHLGLLIPMINETVETMERENYTRAVWAIPVSHTRMVRFMQKWFQPYASFTGESRVVAKTLPANPAAQP